MSFSVFINHTGSSAINFKSLPAQRRLTEALCHRDYGLSLTLPDDRLCPPVSLVVICFYFYLMPDTLEGSSAGNLMCRLNYILWLQDIVISTCGSNTIRGFDIGTGASAIYPLLACRLEPTWSFIATDIDDRSIQSAKQNIAQNSMEGRIVIEHMQADDAILQPLHTSQMDFDFVMCNPPFYSSTEDVSRSAEFKELGPNAICSGAEVEMITPGGETSFVARIFSESLQLRTKCRWYTSMLGKMSSIPDVVSLFREHNVDNYAITEFVQGQTRRWAIGWSFQDARLSDTIARISNPALQNIMPSRNTLHHSFPSARPANTLESVLRNVLAIVDGLLVTSTSATPESSSTTMLVRAQGNTWSRAARRKRLPAAVSADQEPPVLRCSIECCSKVDTPCEIIFTWLEGKDRSVFESFTSHVSRKVISTLRELGDE
ncbi:hypothetical protein AZE42_03613 [Rhizopogon vesiculosus]|uniref:U6 small nuclear RNA (adenine-(43)-N(6))-methyltransferase n=1 Tax=Rhizopogon vesiculosus TaxID=180088 RepID=A0A1J8QKJ5_9AGAM|nr:hypothetical protein AZE42_03613 [Rhizopogon vesiculosus]